MNLPEEEEPTPVAAWLFCVEHYRNSEQQHDAEDYFVDGFVLMRLDLPEDLEPTIVEEQMKRLVTAFVDPANEEEIRSNFPKYAKLREEGGLYWYHLMRKDHKERLPQDFHSNSFTEEELLGLSEPASALPREFWFDRDGDPLEGPPDRIMGLLWG